MPEREANPVFIFRNPHPGGICGCPFPLPEPLEDVANALSGQSLTMTAAGALIQKAIDQLGQQHYRMLMRDGYIAIKRKQGRGVSMWKLIEFIKESNG